MKIGLILFYIVLSQIYLAGSNFQLYQQNKLKNDQEVYNFNHIYWTHDYDLYLPAIVQGSEGAWLFHDNYTTEQTSPGIFYIWYIITGKIAGIFGLSAVAAYHLVRIISQELFIIGIFLLSVEFLGLFWGSVSAIIALTATISPVTFFSAPLAIGIDQPW